MKNKSIETITFDLIDEIANSLKKQKISMSLFLDISKAFNCVDRRKLLEMPKNCGIRDNQLKRMESFLSSRKQCSSDN